MATLNGNNGIGLNCISFPEIFEIRAAASENEGAEGPANLYLFCGNFVLRIACAAISPKSLGEIFSSFSIFFMILLPLIIIALGTIIGIKNPGYYILTIFWFGMGLIFFNVIN